MKNLTSISFFVALFIIGCGKKADTNPKPVITDTPIVQEVKPDSFSFEVDTFSIFEKDSKCDPNGSQCAYCNFYYEKIKKPFLIVHDSVNVFIDTMMHRSMRNISESYKGNDYKKIAKQFIIDSKTADEDGFGGWTWDLTIVIQQSVKELFTVDVSAGGYLGGAHGNYYTTTHHFLITNGKKITVKDIFTNIDEVNKIGEKYFRKKNELDADESLEELGFWFPDNKFTVNDNFTISEDKIYFFYNTYEIAPYAYGPVEFSIPLKDIEKLMKIKLTPIHI